MPVQHHSPGVPDEIAATVAADFERHTGREPQGVHAAPGRVNLIGEHVDYNGGLCLPIALEHATYAAVARRDDGVVTVRSAQQPDGWEGRLDGLDVAALSGWPTYVVGVLWAMAQDGLDVPGMDVLVDSHVPVGSGLSSSAALECSVALGACAAAGIEVDDAMRRRLAAACVRAEGEVAGAPTGGMDQTISLLGTAGHALLLDCRDWTTDQVPWQPEATGLRLMTVDTRASHSLSDGGYGSRRADCEAAARRLGVDLLRDVDDVEGALAALDDERLLRRARHVLTEIPRVTRAADLLRRGDYAALGPLFTESHASLRDDFEVSCAELDAVVDTALAHGALGARMTGGGFGGSAIALVPETRVDEVTGAIGDAFERAGWPDPAVLLSQAGPGARRVR